MEAVARRVASARRTWRRTPAASRRAKYAARSAPSRLFILFPFFFFSSFRPSTLLFLSGRDDGCGRSAIVRTLNSVSLRVLGFWSTAAQESLIQMSLLWVWHGPSAGPGKQFFLGYGPVGTKSNNNWFEKIYYFLSSFSFSVSPFNVFTEWRLLSFKIKEGSILKFQWCDSLFWCCIFPQSGEVFQFFG